MCCTRLAGNAGPKTSPSGHHRTNLSGYIFANEACIDNQKKLVKQQYFLHMSSQYDELRPTRGWDHFVRWGIPANFYGFRVLVSSLQQHRSTEANQTLHMFGCLLGWYTIYSFLAALAPWWNLARCKIHFASKSCLLCWQCYCMALQQRASVASGINIYSVFWISKIIILDIKNNYFGYPK